MNTRRRDGWFLPVAFLMATVVCSCGSGGPSGLSPGNACVTVNDGPEVCMSSGLTAERSINSSGILIDVWHSVNADCFARTAEEFSIRVTIPDGLPFPYQVNNKLGSGSFATGSCGWTTNDKNVVSGTIYSAAKDGATTVEGDLTLPYGANVGSPTVDNRNYQCGDSCPGTAMARVRFNVPL